MGSPRLTVEDESVPNEPDRWRSFADAAFQHGHTAREIVIALTRHIATALDVPTPTVFRDEPDSPSALRDQCALIDPGLCAPDVLGHVWEALLSTDERRSQGAHFTPRAVTDELVELALEVLFAGSDAPREQITIWDPACGGGAFLLAACRGIEARLGWRRRDIASAVFASDIDSTALDVTIAALQLWAGEELELRAHCGDALLTLPSDWPADVDLIVGNPPFLGQLTADTARDSVRREALQTEFGAISGTYLDEAGLFVELCLRRAAQNGSVGLILPESILGARDAESVRGSVRNSARLHTLWVDEGQSFAASVDVVGVVFSVTGETCTDKSRTTSVVRGTGSNQQRIGVTSEPGPLSWAPLLAFAQGVPTVEIDGESRLGGLTQITAGFRQHFYGLEGAVLDGSPSTQAPSLVTSGAIEPLDCKWGSRKVKFAGDTWESPTVCLDRIEDDAVRDWFAARQVPKLLLASQTKVLEAIVDPDALMVPSVPVVSVEPMDPTTLWHIAAVCTAPAVTAWMLSRAAGTGLSHDAIRVRAATILEIPLPSNHEQWDFGAQHAQAAHDASRRGDLASYVGALRDLAGAMDAAYGVGGDVGAWWWKRLRLPEGFEDTPY